MVELMCLCMHACMHATGPNVRFPLCRAYQNMSFPTCLAEDRAEF